MKNLAAKTTWGDLILTVSATALLKCELPAAKKCPFEYLGLTANHPLAQNIDQYLRDFFRGKPARYSGRLEPLGTGFQQQVWQALLTIPCGETRTYGQIAKQTRNPKAVRPAGGACGANPIPLFIPCHRVTATNGIGGFSAGPEWKQQLLNLEGHNL